MQRLLFGELTRNNREGLYSPSPMTPLLIFHDNLPLSLYIHLPWCVRKCPYCDFNSHEGGQDEARQLQYIDALIRDLEQELPRIWGRRINTIFIGGGTPSLFSIKAMEQLMAGLRARLNFYPDIEITLEANPGTAEANKFKAFRDLGINRLSIGVQSFNDTRLQQLGRIHTASEAHTAIDLAQAAGFESLNTDLMYGLPEQSVADSLQDLQKAIAHEPSHLSRYQLTIEPNTVFYARPPKLPDDDVINEMQEAGDELMARQGYQQYEISAYARPDQQCLHNLNYWQFGDYLGLGAGAHGKLTDVSAGTVTRYARHRLPERYMQLAGTVDAITKERQLNRIDLSLEFMMNALRLTQGVSPDLFRQRTGMPLSVIEAELKHAEENGLLVWDLATLKPTESGRRYLNDLLQYFMPESESEKCPAD